MLFYLTNIKRAVKSVRGFLKTIKCVTRTSSTKPSIVMNITERPDILERFLVINESMPQKKVSNDSTVSLPDGNFLYADDVETPWQDETEEINRIPEQTKAYKLSRDVQQLKKPVGHIITQQRYYADISKYIPLNIDVDNLSCANDK